MRRLLLSAAALAALVCLLILPAGAADTGVEPLLRQAFSRRHHRHLPGMRI